MTPAEHDPTELQRQANLLRVSTQPIPEDARQELADALDAYADALPKLKWAARLGQALTMLKQQPIVAVKDDSGFTSIKMPSDVADEFYAVATSADALTAQLDAEST